jgi:hypothetical protein
LETALANHSETAMVWEIATAGMLETAMVTDFG